MYLLDAILHSVNLKVPRRASSERHSSEQSIQICFWLETFCGKNRLWLEVSVREDSKRRPWHHRGWWDWRWIDCEMLFDVRKYAISYYSISYYSIVTIARRTHCVLHRLLKGGTMNDERYLHQRRKREVRFKIAFDTKLWNGSVFRARRVCIGSIDSELSIRAPSMAV